jgi:hypothetical protein
MRFWLGLFFCIVLGLDARAYTCSYEFDPVGHPGVLLPEGEEYKAWLASSEYATCVSSCKEAHQIVTCVSVGPCSCDEHCYESDGAKYCARVEGANQSNAQRAAADANRAASSTSAAVGVISIADGMNSLGEADARAGVLIEMGQGAIKTAADLKKAELEGGDAADKMASTQVAAKSDRDTLLVADPTMLSSNAADKILSTLEGKYGIKREEFAAKVLDSRGSRESLDEIFGAKAAEKMSKAFSASGELSDEEKKRVAQAAEGASVMGGTSDFEIHYGKGTPKSSDLRSTLRKKLAAQEEPADRFAKSSSVVKRKTVPQQDAATFENLTAISEEELPGQRDPASEEWSIFDVVHRKYMERAVMLKSR